MVTKEMAKDFLTKCREENISPSFAFCLIDAIGPRYASDDYKILSIKECEEWALKTVFSFKEIASYFLKKSEYHKL